MVLNDKSFNFSFFGNTDIILVAVMVLSMLYISIYLERLRSNFLLL